MHLVTSVMVSIPQKSSKLASVIPIGTPCLLGSSSVCVALFQGC